MPLSQHAAYAILGFTLGAAIAANTRQEPQQSPPPTNPAFQLEPRATAKTPPAAPKATTRASAHAPSPYRSPVEWTIHQLESSGRLGPISHDGGAGLGPLAIHRGAWQDAQEHLGTPERPYHLAADLAESLRALRGYVDRYGAETPADIFGLWNAGPRHAQKTGTAARNKNRYIERGLAILKRCPLQ